MKNIRLLLGTLLIFTLTSCELEPYELPAEEIYLRNFIKKFGLIDPNQTWSMAKAEEVKIIPDGHADRVRISGEADGRFYLVADITDVNHEITVPIDLPEYVDILKVEIDDKVYYTKVGDVVDEKNPQSREGLSNGYVGQVKPVRITDTNAPVDYPVEQIYELFNLLKEGGQHDGNFPGNLEVSSIRTDFLLNSGPTGKEITVHPVFWNTCQTHELGIYYFSTNISSQESAATIERVPFYRMIKAPEFEDMNYYLSQDQYGYRFNKYGVNTSDNNKPTLSTQHMTWNDYVSEQTSTTNHTNILPYNDARGEWWAGPFEVVVNTQKYEVNANGNPGLKWHEGHNWYGVSFTEDQKANGHSWENQFRIKCPRKLIPGEKVRIKADICAQHPVNGVSIQLESSTDGYIGQGPGVNFPASVVDGNETHGTMDVEFTVPYNSNMPNSLIDLIIFSVNHNYGTTENPAYANTYYFNNVELIVSPYEPEWAIPYDVNKLNNTYRPIGQGTYTFGNHYYIDANRTLEPTYNGVNYMNTSSSVTPNATDAAKIANSHLLIRNTSNQLCYPLADTPTRSAAFLNTPGHKVVSKGIKIDIPANTRYGFYLHFYDNKNNDVEKYIYSEVKGNIDFLKREGAYGENNSSTKVAWTTYNDQNVEDRRKATYAAIFDQKYNGHDYTYLTFEDWTPSPPRTGQTINNNPVGDYDLNDLAFLIENVNIETEIEQEKNFGYIVCAEDLGINDDFDFNDMIVGVDVLATGTGDNIKKVVTFHALAGGGTLPLYLHLKYTDPKGEEHDDLLCPDGVDPNNPEWHKWFGVNNVSEMINTQMGKAYLLGKSVTIEANKNFSLENFGRIKDHEGMKGINGIYVTVNSKYVNQAQDSFDPADEHTIQAPQPGSAPQMFIIADQGYLSGEGENTVYRNWQWPSERSHMYTAYPAFELWVHDANSNKDWFKNKPEHGVYTKRPR